MNRQMLATTKKNRATKMLTLMLALLIATSILYLFPFAARADTSLDAQYTADTEGKVVIGWGRAAEVGTRLVLYMHQPDGQYSLHTNKDVSGLTEQVLELGLVPGSEALNCQAALLTASELGLLGELPAVYSPDFFSSAPLAGLVLAALHLPESPGGTEEPQALTDPEGFDVPISPAAFEALAASHVTFENISRPLQRPSIALLNDELQLNIQTNKAIEQIEWLGADGLVVTNSSVNSDTATVNLRVVSTPSNNSLGFSVRITSSVEGTESLTLNSISPEYSNLAIQFANEDPGINVSSFKVEKIRDANAGDDLSGLDASYFGPGDTVRGTIVLALAVPDLVITGTFAGKVQTWLESSDAPAGSKYTFEHTVQSEDVPSNGPIHIDFKLKTSTGTTSVTLGSTNLARPIFGVHSSNVTVVSLTSWWIEGGSEGIQEDNGAAIGDVLRLSFTSNCPIVTTGINQGQTYPFTVNQSSHTASPPQWHYTLEYQVQAADIGNIEIGDILPEIVVHLRNVAGQSLVIDRSKHNTDIIFLGENGPDADPNIVKVEMSSGKTIPTNGQHCAGQGDVVVVTIYTAAPINNSTGRVYARIGSSRNETQLRPSGVRENDSNGVQRFKYSVSVFLSDVEGLSDNQELPIELVRKSRRGSVESLLYKWNRWISNPSSPEPASKIIFWGPISIATWDMVSDASAPAIVCDGKTVTLSLTTNHEINVVSAAVGGINAAEKASVQDNQPSWENNHSGDLKTWVFKYTLNNTDNGAPTLLGGADDDAPLNWVLELSDLLGQSLTINLEHLYQAYMSEANWQAPSYLPSGFNFDTSLVTYYAPIQFAPEMSSGKTHPDFGYQVARDGDALVVKFFTGHPIEGLSDLFITDTSDTGQLPAASRIRVAHTDYTFSETATPGFGYENIIRFYLPSLGQELDLLYMKPVVCVTDIAEQSYTYQDAYAGAEPYVSVRYYAPIQISNIAITSTNSKAPSKYVKNSDTITVSFVSNHEVLLNGSIAGIPVANFSRDGSGSEKNIAWTYTYTVQGGELADLAMVPFQFTAEDVAGNAPVSIDQNTPGVMNQLQYYAPITSTAAIESNGRNRNYAKNGDTVTVRFATNHNTFVAAGLIAGRSVGMDGADTMLPYAFYQIPAGEGSIPEGELSFEITLEDVAGNELKVARITDGSRVIYDRTRPTVRLTPLFNGYTNEDITFSAVYEDMNQDAGALSLIFNGMETITATDRAAAGSSYAKQITLTEEGSYRLVATAIDLAGNEVEMAVTLVFTLDKTSPRIQMLLDRNTFKTGFTLDELFFIEEANLRDVVCTISDGEGVHDWSLDRPILPEGRKTVVLLANDLAGNSSPPTTFDIYIDATAPRPVVQNEVNNVQLSFGTDNELIGNGQLVIGLEALQMGDEGPDFFTTLRLLDENGNVVQDLLAADADPAGTFTLIIPSHGSYVLVVAAQDDVGNETGSLGYQITYRAATLGELIDQDIPGGFLAKGGGWLLGIGGIGGAAIFFLVLWRVRKKKEQEA